MADESPEEFILKRMEDDPKVKEIAESARKYAELMAQPGWQKLIEMIKREKEEWLLDLAKRQFDGEEVSEREIRFYSGFWRGADYVLRHPEVAEDSFVKAARLAWAMYEGQAESNNQEGSSPYA